MDNNRKDHRKQSIKLRRRSYNYRTTFGRDFSRRSSLLPISSQSNSTHNSNAPKSVRVYTNPIPSSTATSMGAFNFNIAPIRSLSILALSKSDVNNYPNHKNLLCLPQQSKKMPLFQILPRESLKRIFVIHNNLFQYETPSKNNLRKLDSPPLDGYRVFKKTSSKSKPSDKDVIFGNAKKFLAHARGWERSRIQWLLDLERRQENNKRSQGTNVEDDENHDLLDLCCFPFVKGMLMHCDKQ